MANDAPKVYKVWNNKTCKVEYLTLSDDMLFEIKYGNLQSTYTLYA